MLYDRFPPDRAGWKNLGVAQSAKKQWPVMKSESGRLFVFSTDGPSKWPLDEEEK